MEIFISKHTTLPKKFIKDFFFITEKTHSDTEIVVNFDVVTQWLETKKSHLKKVLVNNFEKEYDYTETSLTKLTGGKTNNYKQILISSACFKELCMISQTKKAKHVRKYFLEMEKIVKKYYEVINENLNKEVGLLKQNQKPKQKMPEKGVVYVIEAMNSAAEQKLYKIGQTDNLEDRLKTYNSGNSNNVKILFKIKVNDRKKVETCVKSAMKEFQYRVKKEIYQTNIKIIRTIMKKCKVFYEGLEKVYIEHKENVSKGIKRIKGNKNNFFLIFTNEPEESSDSDSSDD
jgi:phage anti-repressor protein